MSYTIFHPTYTSAVTEALSVAMLDGYTTDDEDFFHTVSTGTVKPSEGNTTRFSLPLYSPKGTECREALHVQVYNRGTDRNTYELNCYIL